MFSLYINGEIIDVEKKLNTNGNPKSKKMEVLESAYHFCDLLYNYCSKFDEEDCGKVMERKKEISEKIIEILQTSEFSKRKCKYCGKTLPWNYPYSMCEKCYHNRRWSYYDDDYDLY